MTKKWEPLKDDFESLYRWLADDREQAGAVYEAIRRNLIKMLARRGCLHPEELADETINRVILKLPELEGYTGERGRYFTSVARYLLKEYNRNAGMNPLPLNENVLRADDEDEVTLRELRSQCLDACLAKLSDEDRGLIMLYYQNLDLPKAQQRKKVAMQLDLTPTNLRVRAFRIRASLTKCMMTCMKASPDRETKGPKAS